MPVVLRATCGVAGHAGREVESPQEQYASRRTGEWLLRNRTRALNERDYEIWGVPILPAFLFLFVVVAVGTELRTAHDEVR